MTIIAGSGTVSDPEKMALKRTRPINRTRNFSFFITNYNIQVLHDFDNGNKRRRRVWTVSDEWYGLGHVV